MKSRALTLSILSLLVVACASSPLGRRQLKLVSDDTVNQQGITAFTELKTKTPATKDAKESAYVQCVANGITSVIPQMPWNVPIPPSWEVVTFESKEVNAFALPGGKIGVYTGLLAVAKNQDQLGAVLGHEVSHVLAGHSAERVSSNEVNAVGTAAVSVFTGVSAQALSPLTKTLFLLPYSRAHESEADLMGMDLMSKAGFDPEQAIALWNNMAAQGGDKPPQMLSTHPSDQNRIAALTKRLSLDEPVYQAARNAGLRPNCVR